MLVIRNLMRSSVVEGLVDFRDGLRNAVADLARRALSDPAPLTELRLSDAVSFPIPPVGEPLIRPCVLWAGMNLATSKGAMAQMYLKLLRLEFPGRVTTIGWLPSSYTARPGPFLRVNIRGSAKSVTIVFGPKGGSHAGFNVYIESQADTIEKEASLRRAFVESGWKLQDSEKLLGDANPIGILKIYDRRFSALLQEKQSDEESMRPHADAQSLGRSFVPATAMDEVAWAHPIEALATLLCSDIGFRSRGHVVLNRKDVCGVYFFAQWVIGLLPWDDASLILPVDAYPRMIALSILEAAMDLIDALRNSGNTALTQDGRVLLLDLGAPDAPFAHPELLDNRQRVAALIESIKHRFLMTATMNLWPILWRFGRVRQCLNALEETPSAPAVRRG